MKFFLGCGQCVDAATAKKERKAKESTEKTVFTTMMDVEKMGAEETKTCMGHAISVRLGEAALPLARVKEKKVIQSMNLKNLEYQEKNVF